jgi:hypothetical protein
MSIHCTMSSSGIRTSGSNRTGMSGRPSERARLISAKHHWDATDAALARKTIASARRSRV